MINIVYQVYGKEELFTETYGALLSLAPYASALPPFRVIIYTDKPEHIHTLTAPFDVITEVLTPERIQEWQGDNNFVHRLKIMMLRDVLSKYDGALLYMDSDTFFVENPSSLFQDITQGACYMHCRETTLNDPSVLVFKKVARFLKKNPTLLQGHPYRPGGQTEVWNAGLLGLPATATPLLDDVLKVSDTLHAGYAKHIMEQLAFSVVLGKNYTLQPADSVVFHYWHQKPEYREWIAGLMTDKGRMAEALTTKTPVVIPTLAKRKKKNFFQKLFRI